MSTKNKETQTKMLKGMVGFNIELLREGNTFRIADALGELYDNGFDSNASDISINVENPKNSVKTLVYKDNGCGMSYDELHKVFENFTHHEKAINAMAERMKIGNKGRGMKLALMRLAKCSGNDSAQVIIKSSTGDNIMTQVVWTLSSNEDMFFSPKFSRCFNDDGMRGTEIRVENCEDFDGHTLGNGKLTERLGRVYSNAINKNTKIKLFGKEIKGTDNMRLNILGDNINNDGVYQSGCYIHLVKTLNLSYKGDTKNVKVVGLYVNLDDEKANKETEFTRGGIYCLKGGKYINHGGTNTRDMLGDKSSAGMSVTLRNGPEGRIRLMILIDNDNSPLFNIASNKSLGVSPLVDNMYADAYKDASGVSFRDNLIYIREMMFDMHKVLKAGDSQVKHVITRDEAEEYFKKNSNFIPSVSLKNVKPTLETANKKFNNSKKPVIPQFITLERNTYNYTINEKYERHISIYDKEIIKLFCDEMYQSEVEGESISFPAKEKMLNRFVHGLYEKNIKHRS